MHIYTRTLSLGVQSFLQQRKYGALVATNGAVLRALLTFRLSAFRPIYLPPTLPSGISFVLSQREVSNAGASRRLRAACVSAL